MFSGKRLQCADVTRPLAVVWLIVATEPGVGSKAKGSAELGGRRLTQLGYWHGISCPC